MARGTVRRPVRDRLRSLAAKGFTQSEAARELGVSRQRVSQLKAQLGLVFRPNAPEVPKERLEELASKGLTRTEAAKELGMSWKRVSQLAARLDVSFAPAWSRPQAAGSELGRIVQTARLASGYSYPRLAALSGLYWGHIRSIERGKVRRPTDRTLRALADALHSHTSYEELAGATPPGDQAVLGQQAKELAQQGLTKTEAARQMGVSRERLRVLAGKLDLTFTPFRREPKAPATEFGRVMQKARLASGYSYSRLAALSGLHRRHVLDLEVGRIRRPTEKTLRKLANCLGGRAVYDKLLRAAHGSQRSAQVRPQPSATRRRSARTGRKNKKR